MVRSRFVVAGGFETRPYIRGRVDTELCVSVSGMWVSSKEPIHR